MGLRPIRTRRVRLWKSSPPHHNQIFRVAQHLPQHAISQPNTLMVEGVVHGLAGEDPRQAHAHTAKIREPIGWSL